MKIDPRDPTDSVAVGPVSATLHTKSLGWILIMVSSDWYLDAILAGG